MAVGDREFGALLERVDGLTQAVHDALPALQRQDTCQLTCQQFRQQLAEVRAEVAALRGERGLGRAGRAALAAAAVTGILALIGVIAQAVLK